MSLMWAGSFVVTGSNHPSTNFGYYSTNFKWFNYYFVIIMPVDSIYFTFARIRVWVLVGFAVMLPIIPTYHQACDIFEIVMKVASWVVCATNFGVSETCAGWSWLMFAGSRTGVWPAARGSTRWCGLWSVRCRQPTKGCRWTCCRWWTCTGGASPRNRLLVLFGWVLRQRLRLDASWRARDGQQSMHLLYLILPFQLSSHCILWLCSLLAPRRGWGACVVLYNHDQLRNLCRFGFIW